MVPRVPKSHVISMDYTMQHAALGWINKHLLILLVLHQSGNAQVSCPNGDSTGVVKNEQTCVQLVTSSKFECYDPDIEATCCASCNAQNTGVSGCEFGDRTTCFAFLCDSLVNQEDCCDTCGSTETLPTTLTTTIATTTWPNTPPTETTVTTTIPTTFTTTSSTEGTPPTTVTTTTASPTTTTTTTAAQVTIATTPSTTSQQTTSTVTTTAQPTTTTTTTTTIVTIATTTPTSTQQPTTTTTTSTVATIATTIAAPTTQSTTQTTTATQQPTTTVAATSGTTTSVALTTQASTTQPPPTTITTTTAVTPGVIVTTSGAQNVTGAAAFGASSQSGGNKDAAIIGGTIGGLVGLSMIVGCVALTIFMWKKKKRNQIQNLPEDTLPPKYDNLDNYPGPEVALPMVPIEQAGDSTNITNQTEPKVSNKSNNEETLLKEPRAVTFGTPPQYAPSVSEPSGQKVPTVIKRPLSLPPLDISGLNPSSGATENGDVVNDSKTSNSKSKLKKTKAIKNPSPLTIDNVPQNVVTNDIEDPKASFLMLEDNVLPKK